MTGSGIEGLKKKAVSRVPKLAKTIHAGCVAMDVKWGDKVPSEGDIIATLTCLINDLNGNMGAIESSTGRLFARLGDHDGVIEIEFGLEFADYVVKAA